MKKKKAKPIVKKKAAPKKQEPVIKIKHKPEEWFSKTDLRAMRISWGQRERQRVAGFKQEIRSLKTELERQKNYRIKAESRYHSLCAVIKKQIEFNAG